MRTIDDIRGQLLKDGQTGIPSDNSRIMDEMLQFKLIVPNSKDKTVWACTLTGGSFEVPQKLTMLRMDINRIYMGNKPKPFIGKIITDEDSIQTLDLPNFIRNHT